MTKLHRYTLHIHPDRPDEPVLVREGFSFGAFLFGGLWLLIQRAWLAGVVCVCISALLDWLLRSGAMEPQVLAFVQLVFGLYLGLEGRDLQRDALARRGYSDEGTIYATGEDAAMLRHYEQQAEAA